MTVISKVKQTLITIKSTQGTIREYSIHERNSEAQKAYKEALEVTSKVINDLEKRVEAMEFEEPQYKEN